MKKARGGCKGNDNGDVRVAGNEEGKGSKEMAMAMVARMAGEWSVTATKRSMAMVTRMAGGGQAMATATKRAMVTAKRMAGKEKAMATAVNGDEGGGRVKRQRG